MLLHITEKKRVCMSKKCEFCFHSVSILMLKAINAMFIKASETNTSWTCVEKELTAVYQLKEQLEYLT